MRPDNGDNNLISRIKRINPLYAAMALSVLMLVAFMFKEGIVVVNSDTQSYVEAWDNSYSNGVIDNFRTPVYPVLIGIGKMIFGAGDWGLLLTALQIIAFYGCGILFSRMMPVVVRNRRIANVCIFVYFLYFPIVRTLPVMGTEALAFSLTTAWIYCVWRFLVMPGAGRGAAIAILTLAGLMLRPSFLLLAIVILFLAVVGVLMKQRRRTALLLLPTLIPTVVVYMLYSDEIERRTGVDTISTVTIVNNYFMARQYNDIFPELLPDNPEAIRQMHRFQKSGDRISYDYLMPMWNEINYFEENGIMTYREMQDYSMAMKEHYPGLWYKYIGVRIADSFREFNPLRMAFNYLTVILYGMLFLAAWIKLRKFPSSFNFMLLLVGGGSLLSVILYAQTDFGRLLLPTTPVLIMMAGRIAACIRLKPFAIKCD